MEYVGILLDSSVYRGIPHARTGQESLVLYELAAAAYDLIPCYMRLEDIHLPSGTCRAYIHSENTYKLNTIKLPYTIHNRAMYFTTASHHKMAGLIQQGILIYNLRNRYKKVQIHRLLSRNSELVPHLPETEPATKHSLARMMAKYSDLIIKPSNGSIGSGVMRLTQRSALWQLSFHPKPGKWRQIRFKQGRLPAFLPARLTRKEHLIQQRIPLATYEDRPFDLRVTVQRGITGEWGVTGMFAKLAASKDAFITNVARGGSAMAVDRIFSSAFPHVAADKLQSRIHHLALTAAHQLSVELPHIADLGIDLGITAAGELYLIECNGRDQRYGFRKAGMPEEWAQSYREPMAYARYLLDQKPFAASLNNLKLIT
ncbi:YheC/YheD family protein [Paenibacillus sp. PDC88]|uniref:YheC/YheD family endospore coat-associated protein n=1 Tax=Paenibacillus sp. PDC88 TaxID=1884375 RepID=UPI00089898F5|nr:YheC/YheD family protein [Paenibacillus sp. PDC88]SDX51030.1 Glutathione synthase/RimK-type ligase, ATP-grasp superfamily [Paenibacillus sp. PDC88]